MTQCKYVKLEHLGKNQLQAICTECEYRSTNLGSGGVDGTAHAKETGHRVEVERLTSYFINPYNK